MRAFLRKSDVENRSGLTNGLAGDDLEFGPDSVGHLSASLEIGMTHYHHPIPD
jgi:hypothetical protein